MHGTPFICDLNFNRNEAKKNQNGPAKKLGCQAVGRT